MKRDTSSTQKPVACSFNVLTIGSQQILAVMSGHQSHYSDLNTTNIQLLFSTRREELYLL